MGLVSASDVDDASVVDLREALDMIRRRLRTGAAQRVSTAVRRWVTDEEFSEAARLEVVFSHPLSGAVDGWVTPFDIDDDMMEFESEALSSFWKMLNQSVGSVADFDDGTAGSFGLIVDVTGSQTFAWL